jgi:hypothetical protein
MPGTDIETRPGGTLVPVPGLPQRKRESEAPIPRAFRSARRNRHISVPLAVPPAVWTAGEILYVRGLFVPAASAAAAGAIALWVFAPHKWTDGKGAARAPEVWYARLSAVALGAYLAAAAKWGATSGLSGEALGAFLLAGGLAWGVPWYRHYRVRGMKEREGFLRDCRAFWDGHAAAWGAGGSNVIDAEEKPAQTWLLIQLIGGRQSLLTLKGSVHLIESAARVGRGMVRIAEVEGDASQAEVFIKRANPLKGVIAWYPSLAPASVHDDVFRGASETGERVMVAQRVSSFINGRSRSGKSNYEQLRIAELSGCADARAFVIDLKQRNARPLLKSGAVDWVITDPDEAGAALRMLAAEIDARSREWDTGTEQALATPQTPALFALVDETNPLTSEMAGPGGALRARYLAAVASRGSGVEVYADVSTQYGALAESVQTEQTRMNLPLRVCFAVEHPDHGVFALGDGGGDASRLEEKGEHLMKLGPRAKPEKVRAAAMPHELLEQVCAANGRRVRKPRLILFCGAEPSGIGNLTWQEWYDQRHLRIHPKLRGISPQYQAAVEEFGEPGAAPSGTAAGAEFSRPRMAPAPPDGGDAESGASVAARIAAETEGPDVSPTAEARAKAAEIYAQVEERFFSMLAAAPPAGVRTAALIEESGMSNGQAYKILNRLAERGAVTRPGRGLYAPVPGRAARAEYTAIRAGDDALGRGAADRVARHLQSVG